MQTKDHSTLELRVRLVPSDMSSDLIADSSKAMLLLWIILCYLCFMFMCYSVFYVLCSLVNTSWERGQGLPIGCLEYCVFLCFCHFPIWCSRPGMVLDCIDS